MNSRYITHNNSSIHYRLFGKGPKLVFCFHGYGTESNTFAVLERRLGAAYTLVAIDVPNHGLTAWREDAVLEPKQLVALLVQIRRNFGRESSPFILVGFSMGGRIAMHLAQLMADKTERLVLLATDGLKFNFWRWLGSDTWLGNRIVAYIIHHPVWVSRILKRLQKWKIIQSGVAGFLGYYLENDEYRLLFYHRYFSMRKFKPNLNQLKRLIRKHRISVRMMFGRHDQIIPFSSGESFKRGIEAFVTVEVAEAGHNLLNEGQVNRIAQMISG